MKKGFKFGIATGVIGSAIAVVSAGFGYQKLVKKPQQQADEDYEAVSKAAVRKSVAAHQSRF